MNIDKDYYLIDRRTFLKGGISLILAGFMGGCKEKIDNSSIIWPCENENLPYKVSGWFGNTYEMAHKFRDGFEPPEPKADEKKELVVVGAGLSGLTVAFKLREMDLIVLEHENEPGGNAKSMKLKGHSFNTGSLYFSDVSESFQSLYDEIDIKPVEIPLPGESWKRGNKFIVEPFGDENINTLPGKIKDKMIALRDAVEEVYNGDDFPDIPCENSSSKAMELDKITFAEWLKPYLTEEIKSFIDSYCYSAMGASSDTVSAYGGLNFYSSEIAGKSYSFPDGNSHIAMALVKGIEKSGKDRIRLSSYVYRIKQKSNGNVLVYYFQNGEARAIEAEKVVVSTPYFITSRIIDGLSDGQRGALSSPQYGSYITANLRFNKKIHFDSYSICAPDAGYFTDFMDTEWTEKNKKEPQKEKSQIITCFAPYKRPAMGRCEMMLEAKEQICQRIVNAFEKIIPGSVKHIEEVYLTRWGHAIIINEPYMYTKWLPSIEKNTGSIYLSHSDGQGLPALEYALYEAFNTIDYLKNNY